MGVPENFRHMDCGPMGKSYFLENKFMEAGLDVSKGIFQIVTASTVIVRGCTSIDFCLPEKKHLTTILNGGLLVHDFFMDEKPRDAHFVRS